MPSRERERDRVVGLGEDGLDGEGRAERVEGLLGEVGVLGFEVEFDEGGAGLARCTADEGVPDGDWSRWSVKASAKPRASQLSQTNW